MTDQSVGVHVTRPPFAALVGKRIGASSLGARAAPEQNDASCDRPKAQFLKSNANVCRASGRCALTASLGTPLCKFLAQKVPAAVIFANFRGFFPQDRPNLRGVSADRVPVAFQACYEAPRRPKRPSRTLRKAPAGTLPSAPYDSRALVPLSQLVRKRSFFESSQLRGAGK